MTVTETREATVRAPRESTRSESGFAPMIANAWYAIAPTSAVGRELGAITIIGQPLVYFRAEDGTAVVLDDRCAHRRFSLAKSHLKGDTIQCAYHGFTYDREGACVFAPGVSGKLNFGVRKYPSVERGPWLWVWMGDGPGDPADIPLPAVADEQWFGPSGYTLNPANYLLVHENLLDVTHLHYLHGPEVCSEEYANTPPTALTPPDDITVGHLKEVASTAFNLPAVFCGGDPTVLVRQVQEVWTKGPALNWGLAMYYGPDGQPTTPHRLLVMHAISPENESSTHQFWAVLVDAPLALPEEALAGGIHQIFAQDVTTLDLQHRYTQADTRTGVLENSIPSDVHGLKLRRILHRLAAQERE